MPNLKIDRFGEILVREVRDAAIRNCDINCRPDAQSVEAVQWRKLGIESSNLLVKTIIPDCVDATLFFLLNAIDQGLLRLQFVAEDGSIVDLTNDGLGELAGWYFLNDGWRASFSGERFTDSDDTAVARK